MELVIFFTLFSSIFLTTEAAKCGPDSPDILYPFSLLKLQPQNCSYDGFKLFCRRNKTVIQLPSYGYLEVKSISYDTKMLSLIDPWSCVHGVFLNLNVSLTPFQYYYVVKNYTYLNCSVLLSPSFVQVPCLSGSKHHVYVVEPSKAVPAFCRVVKTVAIPFAYSPYLDDGSFGLGFTWDLPEGSKVEGMKHESWTKCFNLAHGRGISILLFIFMAAALVAKVYCSKNDWEGKFFRQYETLKLAEKTRGGDYGSESKGMLPNATRVCVVETTVIDEN